MGNVAVTKPMLDSIHFLDHPVRTVVIELPQDVFTRCQEFAHDVYESNRKCYASRGQRNKANIIRQIITGKLGEFGVYYYLTTFLGSHCTEPDLKVYHWGKNYDADLCAGKPLEPMDRRHIHVKSILCNQAKRYGLSWLMEKNDPIFKLQRPELMAYCQVLGKSIVHFYGFQLSDKLTLGVPKKTSLESKCALYFNDQEGEYLNFVL